MKPRDSSPGLLDSMLRLTAPALETGLDTLHDVLWECESRVGAAVGARPMSASAATSDLANRMTRLVLRAGSDPAAATEVWGQLVDSLARHLEPDAPRRWLGLPFELPLAFGSLAVQEALRVLTVAQVVPVSRMPDFLAFTTEIFSDLETYFSLRYRRKLERLTEQVRRAPRDARARLELGRTYLKCGLFDEAVRELGIAAREPKLRSQALYEGLVAAYRSGDFPAAIAGGVACLEREPGNERARYWLWLTSRKIGGYPEAVPPALRMTVRDGYQPTGVELEDVAERIGLDKTSGGRGTAVFDLDGDGHLDVVVAGAHAGCGVYRNNGDGTFTDISTGSGLDECVYGFAIAVGDYDNDGWGDLFITSLGFFDGQSSLYRNNRDGTFTDVTTEAGIDCWGPAFTAAWADYDLDGNLDLFVANNLGGLFDRKTPNRLFRNNGDGTFTEVAAEAGIDTAWTTIGAAWGDFNNNGYPDLFVSNLGRSQLFRNNGDGSFTDVSREAGIDAPAIGSVALACDIDDDGWLDIVQFTYSRPEEAIHTLRHGHGPPHGSPLRIYRNRRDGTFELISRRLGITGCWGTMSAAAGDFDNDGHLDLFLGNGDPGMDRTEASVLLANDGGRRFRNVSFSAGLPFTGKGHGVNMADLAGDGRLHLIVASGGLYPGDLQTNQVYRPRRLPGNFLNVRLVGTASNRDAIGARLALRNAGREQHRLVSGGSNFGCLPFEQHFGLGDSQGAEHLDVRWPSGARQRVEGLPLNATIEVVEGRPGWRPARGRTAGGGLKPESRVPPGSP